MGSLASDIRRFYFEHIKSIEQISMILHGGRHLEQVHFKSIKVRSTTSIGNQLGMPNNQPNSNLILLKLFKAENPIAT